MPAAPRIGGPGERLEMSRPWRRAGRTASMSQHGDITDPDRRTDSGRSLAGPTGPPGAARRQIVYWCLYDWANSAFAAIVLSFVFAPYFLEQVAADPVRGQAQWGFAISGSAAAVALLSPILGAFADRSGRRRLWLGGCSLVAILATFGLWWVAPGTQSLVAALLLLAVGNAAFEIGYVFYNALLPAVAPPGKTGRVSGFGWGAGYFGSLASLGVVYALLIAPDPPLFGLDQAMAEPLRLAAPVAALWFLVFAAPILLFGPHEAPTREPARRIVAEGLRDLWATLKALPRMPSIAWFLAAHMFYIDAVNTLFVFGPLVAKGAFGFTDAEMLGFGVTVMAAAGVGAIGFGSVEDRVGAKPVIVLSIVVLAGLSISIAFLQSKSAMWGLSLVLALFFGPVQASSRSLMARLAPAEMQTKLFGLYALAGRATGPLGAALVGWATLATGSQKAGIAVVAVAFALGLALMIPVREAPAVPDRG
jgi:UMF1 family MFS transporter